MPHPIVAEPGAIESSDPNPTVAVYSHTKRFIDLVGAICSLILLGPLMLILAVLIRLDSSGPALFRQVRLGHGGRPFWCLKFRTMSTDAEHRLRELEAMNEVSSGVLFKIRRDPRVTRLGRILRQTSLDELPQFINVLRGDMSLVGPRPLQLRDCQRLEALDPSGFLKRLSVPSGLTGAWQVSGRSNLDADDMLDLDVAYVDNWSLALDIKIILRTILVVLDRRGAY
jgi:lipopolysaccharide/colanic/teichoic acid biosynthesis glycosyltransferase